MDGEGVGFKDDKIGGLRLKNAGGETNRKQGVELDNSDILMSRFADEMTKFKAV